MKVSSYIFGKSLHILLVLEKQKLPNFIATIFTSLRSIDHNNPICFILTVIINRTIIT